MAIGLQRNDFFFNLIISLKTLKVLPIVLCLDIKEQLEYMLLFSAKCNSLIRLTLSTCTQEYSNLKDNS